MYIYLLSLLWDNSKSPFIYQKARGVFRKRHTEKRVALSQEIKHGGAASEALLGEKEGVWVEWWAALGSGVVAAARRRRLLWVSSVVGSGVGHTVALLIIILGDAISAADWNESCLLVPGGHPLRDTGQEGQDGVGTQRHRHTHALLYMYICLFIIIHHICV